MTVRFGAPLHIFGNALRAFSLLPAIFHLHQKGNLNSFCCVAAGCASERKISSPMLRRNGTFCSLRLGRCHSFGFGSSGPSSGISSGKRLIRICLFATNAAGAVVGHSASVPVRVASCRIVQPLSAAVGISASYPTAGTGNAIQRRRLRLFGSTLFLDIAVVKWVSAFRTEFRRMSWVFRLPAAFVAFVQRLCFRFLCAALWAEFAFVDCAAGAYPAFLCRCRFRFLYAALRTEFAGDNISASTLPAVSRRLRLRFLAAAVRAEVSGDAALTAATGPTLCRRLWCWFCCRCRFWCRLWFAASTTEAVGIHMAAGAFPLCLLLHLLLHLLLLTHLEQVLCVHTACLTSHAHSHECHSRTSRGVGSCCLHRCALRAYQMCCCTGRVHEGCVALQLFDHLLVFLVSLDAGNTEGYDFHASQVAPFGGKLFVEGICQLQGMTRKSGITNAHFGNFCECRLESGQKLCFHLACDVLGFVIFADITTDIGVEQQRVFQPDAVFAKAADANVYIDACSLVYHAERNRAWGTVFVAGEPWC